MEFDINQLIKFDSLLLILLSFVVPLSFYLFFIYLKTIELSWLRKIFLVTAGKSTSDAIQLGGVPFSLTITSSWTVLLINSRFSEHISVGEKWLLVYGISCGVIIMIYGYVDDQFELRPVFKLCLQLLCMLIFSLLSSRILSPQHSSIAFVIGFFWCVGVINGTNLLDGLDTLSVKLGGITYVAFATAGLLLNSTALIFCSLLSLMPLAAFYFFNRSPAKIHMGEIGGSYIGMTYLVLSTLLYKNISDNYSPWFSMGYALLPLSLPMVELGISFLRRVYNIKSPFKGDRLHIHHILRNYHHLSPSMASNIMAMILLLSLLVSGMISWIFHPLLGLASIIVLQISIYVFIGRKYWKTKDALEISAKSLFNYFRKKDVVIIDSNSIDDFQLFIVGEDRKGADQKKRKPAA